MKQTGGRSRWIKKKLTISYHLLSIRLCAPYISPHLILITTPRRQVFFFPSAEMLKLKLREDKHLARCHPAWNRGAVWKEYILVSHSGFQQTLGNFRSLPRALGSHWRSDIHPQRPSLCNGTINQNNRVGSLINCPASSQFQKIQSSGTKKTEEGVET